MSQMGLAEFAPEAESVASHEAISIASPGKEDDEEKNQDRLRLMQTPNGSNPKCQFAIVCDGTSTSPYAAEAAEFVADQVESLFEPGGLQRTTETLKEMRLALLQKPLKLDEGQSASLRSMFEEIVKKKYQSSYQTTFVSVRLKRAETNSTGMISIKAIGCGDSALFIFQENGELLYNNVNLGSALDRFNHGSPFTAVLPDSYNEEINHVLSDQEYPGDVHLLLCSDGFYDGFTTFNEMHEWLKEHHSKLKDSESVACLAELHSKLNKKKGDDDISFIWMYPARAQPKEEKQAPEVEEPKGTENSHRGNSGGHEPGMLTKFFAAVLRFFRLKAQ